MSYYQAELDEAMALARKGKRAEAVEIVRAVVIESPYDTEALWYLGNMGIELNERYTALKQLVELDPWHDKAKAKIEHMESDPKTLRYLQNNPVEWYEDAKKDLRSKERGEYEEVIEKAPKWFNIFIVLHMLPPLFVMAKPFPTGVTFTLSMVSWLIARNSNIPTPVRVTIAIILAALAWGFLFVTIEYFNYRTTFEVLSNWAGWQQELMAWMDMPQDVNPSDFGLDVPQQP